jgi:aminoglycoside phosphotransferase (APT) family kinase protein
VELQAAADIGDAARRGHDFGEYQAHVLFDDWDDVWRDAAAVSAAAAEFCRRLLRHLAPVWGYRVPSTDFAHNDLHLANILSDGRTITGVIDWDAFALNTRAVDLVAVAFDCARLRQEATVETLVQRVVQIAGSEGARCLVAYRAIAHLSALQRRHEGRHADDVVAAAETIARLLP